MPRGLAIVFLSIALFAPSLAAQDAGVAPPCEIHGHVTIEDVHVIPVHGSMHVETITDRDVRVTPLGRGRFAVRTHRGAPRIEGRTESAIPFALAAERTFEGVARIAAGTGVERLEPAGDVLSGDLPVHEGVRLVSLALTCRDLAATEPTDAALDAMPPPRGPTWRARIARLRVRALPSDDAVPVNVLTTPEARARVAWIERERRPGWARVEASLAHARVAGWVRDTELTLP